MSSLRCRLQLISMLTKGKSCLSILILLTTEQQKSVTNRTFKGEVQNFEHGALFPSYSENLSCIWRLIVMLKGTQLQLPCH